MRRGRSAFWGLWVLDGVDGYLAGKVAVRVGGEVR